MNAPPASVPVGDLAMLDVGQVAELLGVHPRTVRGWNKEGRIPKPVRIGRRTIRWPRHAILALISGAQA